MNQTLTINSYRSIYPMKNTWNRFRSRRFTPAEPAKQLVFSPLAWLKLLYFLHAGDTEVGGFGLSAPDDPLYVQDLLTLSQTVTPTHVAFDDMAVADHFDTCLDHGIQPARCGRIWCHTHPGTNPRPSVVDEHTFERVFGSCDWAVMFILSRTQRSFARLSFGAGPGGQMPLEVAVDWARWPQWVLQSGRSGPSAFLDWAAEYARNVHRRSPSIAATAPTSNQTVDGWGMGGCALPTQLEGLEVPA